MTAYDIFESNQKQIDGLCAERQAHLAQIAGLAAERQAHLDQIDGLVSEKNALRVELGYKQAECERLATLLDDAHAEARKWRRAYSGEEHTAV